MKSFPCPIPGCGLDAKVKRVLAEESWVPLGTRIKRTPVALQRTYLISCPVHSDRMLPKMGGHRTVGNGKKLEERGVRFSRGALAFSTGRQSRENARRPNGRFVLEFRGRLEMRGVVG